MGHYRIGSLCSGYGGLELGAELAFGSMRHVWHAEIDPAASAVLERRWPGVPNLGDISAITATDGWASMPPVDILLAGYPCQGESNAGLRRGADDPRFRWPDVHAAVRALRPRLVVLENVRGHLNRSFPRVVADLAGIGYVGRWRCVRASDVGAAHRRERLFAVAWPADAAPPELPGTAGELHDGALKLLPTPEASDASGGRVASEVGGFRPSGAKRAVTLSTVVAHALLPTPSATRTGNNRGGAAGRVGPVRPSLDQITHLLPTPSARDGRRGAGWGDQPGRPLSETIHRLLPTPRATDGTNGGPNQRWRNGDLALSSAVQPHHLLPTPTVADARNTRNATAGRSEGASFNSGWTLCDVAFAERWGEYAPAIARWEAIISRPAPEPTIEGRRGSRLLSPLFVEWLMGLPAGWVTDLVDHRGSALRVLGNGVVPLAAAHALRLLLAEPGHQAVAA